MMMSASHQSTMMLILKFAFWMIDILLDPLVQRVPVPLRVFIAEPAGLRIDRSLVRGAAIFTREPGQRNDWFTV
jgi:hypothetical protein